MDTTGAAPSKKDAPYPVDLDAFRDGIPALRRVAWLDTASMAPPPEATFRRLDRLMHDWANGDNDWLAWEAEAELAREGFAALIGASAEDISLMASLSEAAATVARCIPSTKIVVYEGEFRSNLFPWLAAERSGAKVDLVGKAKGQALTEALMERIDDETGLVAISEVQSATGERVHLAPIHARCVEVGAMLFVNLTQSLGALRFSLDEVPADLVAAHGYKWLMCPRGAAWLYASSRAMEHLEPLSPSWRSVGPCSNKELYGPPLSIGEGARGLDTSFSWLSFVGAAASLRLLAQLDPVEVERQACGLAAIFRSEVQRMGLSTAPGDQPSQIVVVDVPDASQAVTGLRWCGVLASARSGRVRFGFHGFNSIDDVERALSAFRRVL